MRTTIDIDDDLLAAAQEIARRERTSAGRVVSRMLRTALAGPAASTPKRSSRTPAASGFRPFASRGTPVTNTDIDRLRDNEGT